MIEQISAPNSKIAVGSDLIQNVFPLLPREKMQLRGPELLTTPELLSVILGSGSHNVPVHALAKKIAEKLSQNSKITLAQLQEIKGIGLAKACQILAAIELVERLRPQGAPVLDNLQKVLTHLGELRYASREQILCLYLNARLQLILKETLAIGALNQAIIQPRDVFAVIKYHPISHIIIAHNHPSGNPQPSENDLRLTDTIFQAGNLLGVELLDHIIVGKEQHYSFREQGIFGKKR